MLTIELRFPAGRYHATPWGRSVNEADIEWPPSPWRLLRALLAVWHRKCPELSESDVHALLHKLAEQPPSFYLPPAVHSHTRHYMPQATQKTSLIYDAWLALAPEVPLYIHWPTLTVDERSAKTLALLLSRLNYFGRAESWVDAFITNDEPKINCEPNGATVDPQTGEVVGEPVRVLTAPSADDYSVWLGNNREKLLGQFKGKKRQQLAHIMPDTLAEALDRDTADWLQVDKTPPAFAQWQLYSRPNLSTPQQVRARVNNKQYNIARFALTGKPRLPVRETLRMAEWFRKATIKNADKVPLLSGHDLPEHNRHLHAFYLPEDLDGDGFLDHMLVYVPGGIDDNGEAALHNIHKLYDYKRPPLDVTLLGIGYTHVWASSRASDNDLTGQSTTWRSATPWYCPWYFKPKKELQQEVQRFVKKECQARGLALPVVTLVENQNLKAGEKELPLNRFNYRRQNKPPPPTRKGLLLELQFEQPLTGPLALGYGCHFGLGLFRPV